MCIKSKKRLPSSMHKIAAIQLQLKKSGQRLTEMIEGALPSVTEKTVSNESAIHQNAEHTEEWFSTHQSFTENVALVALLKGCAKQKDLLKGSRIHADILRRGLVEKNIFIGSALVNMYAKCGALAKAQEVFDELPVRDLISWTALIAGYTQHGHGKEALNCFERMQCEGLSPDAVTFACIMKACGSLGAMEKGEELHAQVVRERLLGKSITLGSALVDMYAKCGALTKAQQAFDRLPTQNVVCWNALIGGYAQHGHGAEALNCFEQMQRKGLYPDAITFACIVKACGCLGRAEKGEEVHAKIVREGLLEKDGLLGTALIDMYAKCGALAKAQQVFEQLPVRDVVCWNALIAGYAQHGHGEKALDCFEKMQREDLYPDAFTFACIVKVCGSMGAVGKCNELHAEIIRKGLLEKDALLGTALVDMYAKCGVLAKAQQVFDELPTRNVVSWTALITGYVEQGQGEEALNCFEKMRNEGHFANSVTFVGALKACGSIGAAEKGKEIHHEIAREGMLLGEDALLGTALVDMYAKCGALAQAQEVFDELPVRDLVCWNSLIAGYSQLGKGDIVFDLFDKMLRGGLEPDLVTFTLVLNVCSHSGLLDEGQMYFAMMRKQFGLIPSLEQCTCMIDLFGRAGHFDKALAMIKEMPSSNYFPMWSVLLGACKKWGNLKLGRLAFEHAVRLDDKCAAVYICMNNIYAAAGMEEDAGKVESMRLKNEACEKPGCCWWTDVDGNVHSFHVGDKRHPQIEKICAKLEEVAHKIYLEECSPCLYWMTHVKDVLCEHIEMLAIACALINTPEGAPLRVVKNTQICGDCHSAMTCISKVEKRKILVRDENCFHMFEGGKCHCGEYS